MDRRQFLQKGILTWLTSLSLTLKTPNKSYILTGNLMQSSNYEPERLIPGTHNAIDLVDIASELAQKPTMLNHKQWVVEAYEMAIGAASKAYEYEYIGVNLFRDTGDIVWAREIMEMGIGAYNSSYCLSSIARTIAATDGFSDSKWAAEVFEMAVNTSNTPEELSNIAYAMSYTDEFMSWSRDLFHKAFTNDFEIHASKYFYRISEYLISSLLPEGIWRGEVLTWEEMTMVEGKVLHEALGLPPFLDLLKGKVSRRASLEDKVPLAEETQ